MLATKRGRARQARAGAQAPVLADEQWAEPAAQRIPQTFDQIQQRKHEQQCKGGPKKEVKEWQGRSQRT